MTRTASIMIDGCHSCINNGRVLKYDPGCFKVLLCRSFMIKRTAQSVTVVLRSTSKHSGAYFRTRPNKIDKSINTLLQVASNQSSRHTELLNIQNWAKQKNISLDCNKSCEILFLPTPRGRGGGGTPMNRHHCQQLRVAPPLRRWV